MTKLTLREASRLISTSAMTKGTGGYQFEAAELQTRNITPVLEAEIAAVRAGLRTVAGATDRHPQGVRALAAEGRAVSPAAPAPIPEPLRRRLWWQPA